jgi:predicted phage-related endonuclease
MPERSILLSNVSAKPSDRRSFIGGSDARIIMGDDETALLRLWREKRGEAESPALKWIARAMNELTSDSSHPAAGR